MPLLLFWITSTLISPSMSWLAVCGATPDEPQRISSHGCGRATGYAEANKIVTARGKTHVAWLDSEDDKFWVRVRTLSHESGTWSEPVTVGEGADNHGGPALTMDSEGYLHVVYYPHHHPFRYRKSKRPHDASEWQDVEQFGRRSTYPTLLCGGDDSLLLSCRESHSSRWSLQLYRKPAGDSWQHLREVMRSRFPGYAHFQDAMAWGPGGESLHMTVRVYEKDGAHQTVGYLASPDAGATFQTHDGRDIDLPATAGSIDVLASGDKSAPLRCGTLAVDDAGVPHVLYHIMKELPGDVLLARPGERGWVTESLYEHCRNDFPDMGLCLPGGLMFDASGVLHIVVMAIRPPDRAPENTWGHPSCEVLWLRRAEPGAFQVRQISPTDPDEPHWLPSLERSTNLRPVSTPSVLWTQGGRGTSNSDMLSNEVFWLRLRT